jgi:hypothetical protein
MFCFAAVITLLVEESSRYYQQYLEFIDNGPSLVSDVTESEMCLFLAIVIQVGHDIHDNLKDCWSTTEQFLSPFCDKTVRHDRFIYVHRFLRFSNSVNVFDTDNPNYDRLWKRRQIFDMLSTHIQNITPLVNIWLWMKLTVLFKGQGNFQTIHTKETDVLEYKFMNYVTCLATHMVWVPI